ncbi:MULTISPECIES: helix-turn-helix domain-containing protein [Cysteiniphilum]|uniref:helix-turn-helix domain-containing protein n=1 Tax=Cysteiniphilum TaxID=2056696 RepID=UPI0017802619|nr:MULTISPECIES: hypothetical protein [Cysteiniphilum]
MSNIDINDLLQQSAREAVEIANGNAKGDTHRFLVKNGIDVISIRKKLNMSRAKFSEIYGLKVRTVEKWEQEKNKMDATAISYLTAIANDPDGIKKALS